MSAHNDAYTLSRTEVRPATVCTYRHVHSNVGRTTIAVLAEAPVIAHGLSKIIERNSSFTVTGTTAHLHEVVDLVAAGRARIIVLSASAGSQHRTRWTLECVESAARAAGHTVGTVCIVPTGVKISARAVDVSASAMPTTADGAEGLIRAVFEARFRRLLPDRNGRRPALPSSMRRPADDTRRSPLTPRELQVLQGVADGLSSKHIAEHLGVSVHTVRTHVQRVLAKLGAHTRVRAIAVALDEGLVEQRRLAGSGFALQGALTSDETWRGRADRVEQVTRGERDT